MPRLTAVFLIITLSSIGLPSLNGFIGEFLVLLGAFLWDPRFAAVAATGVILSAVYMLWMVQRVYYGEVTNEENRHLPDLTPREWVVIAPVVAMAIVMGLFPNVFLAPTAPAIDKLVQRVSQGQQMNVQRPARRRPESVANLRNPNRNRQSTIDNADAGLLLRCHRSRWSASRWRRWPPWWPSRSVARASRCRLAASASSAWASRWSAACCSGAATRPASASIQADNFGLFVSITICIVGLLTIAFSGAGRSGATGCRSGEYYALLLFSIAGMIMMAVATDLLTIFLALEILSIAIYVLTGLRRDSPTGIEAAFKYFLLGAFSSAFFLYGVALTYALTGSTRLDRIGTLDGGRGHERQPDDAVRAGPAAGRLLRSRSRRCRSTCGRRTPTKARRPWSPASCRPA